MNGVQSAVAAHGRTHKLDAVRADMGESISKSLDTDAKPRPSCPVCPHILSLNYADSSKEAHTPLQSVSTGERWQSNAMQDGRDLSHDPLPHHPDSLSPLYSHDESPAHQHGDHFPKSRLAESPLEVTCAAAPSSTHSPVHSSFIPAGDERQTHLAAHQEIAPQCDALDKIEECEDMLHEWLILQV